MDPATVVHNFQWLANILQSLCILMGLALLISAFFQLKRYGEMRTFMSYQMTLAGPLTTMLAAVMMLIMPTTLSTFLFAFWSTSNPMHYNHGTQGWQRYIPVVIVFIRIIGVGSFMRGVMLISRVGGMQGSQPGTLPRALLHIIGGILCIHIVGTYHLLENILDLS